MPFSATFNAFRAVLGVSIAAGAGVTAGASASAHAASVSLPSAAAALLDSGPGIGDQLPAPILATAVRGHMPSFRELGVTYVLVFMNSSDAPSRQALPVMDGLAQRFGKKVGVVAISDEPVSIVREFASSPDWAPKLGFVVAADPLRNSLQTVFGQGSWPTLPVAFVVRGGVVQWRGAPADLADVVPDVVDERWDLAAAKRAAEQQRLWEAQMARIDELAKGGRFDEALGALDSSCDSALPAQKQMCAGRRFSLLIGAKRVPEALKVGEEILRAPANLKQPAGIAWTVATVIPGDRDALAFALRAAQQSDRALKGRDPMVGAILARVQWLSGHRSEAAETARRALGLADSPDLRSALREDLRVYAPAAKDAGLSGKPGQK
jgi:thiol-disulfide isomerase/thioredoxin